MQSTERLAELVHSKHQVLVQLHDVGRQQAEMVTCGDIASLLTLLAAKQQLIGSLQALEQELAVYYRQDPEQRVWPSPQARSHCAQLAKACNELLEEIVRLEKLGAEKMTARRNEVAEQLQHVHAAAHVRTAYETHRRSNVS